MSFFQWQDKNLLLELHVQPRSKENTVIGIHDESLKVKIKSPPVDNKANKEIAAYLAYEFNVSKSNIELISGQSSKDKRVLIKDVKVAPDWFKELSDS